MTTPDEPETTTGGSHSAPRPVPPLTVPSLEAIPAPGRMASARAAETDDGEAAEASEPTSNEPGEPQVEETGDDAVATQQMPVTGEVTTTQVVPAGSTPLPSPDPAPTPAQDPTPAATSAAQTREPLPDPEWEEEPTKRTGAHLWGLLAVLVLAPITWFLLTDGALRTFYSLTEVTDSPNLAGLLSLLGGIVGLFVIALVTRNSSLGAWIWGGIITAGGLLFLVMPQLTGEWLIGSRESFEVVHEGFGTNLNNYLFDTGRSGLLLIFGVILLLLAFVAHSARRRGRKEERLKPSA